MRSSASVAKVSLRARPDALRTAHTTAKAASAAQTKKCSSLGISGQAFAHDDKPLQSSTILPELPDFISSMASLNCV